MNKDSRKLTRLAGAIQQQLAAQQTSRFREVIRQVGLLLDIANYLRGARTRLAVCLERDWPAARKAVADRASQSLRDLPYYAEEIDKAITACQMQVPSVRDIHAELLQVQSEFEQVEYRPETGHLVVTTDPIELEDIFLGEFEIKLHIPSLADTGRHNSAYRIVAIDPHPAGCNEHVTHPHVSDEHLCEGDAGAAIHAALAAGRLCDFFMLVRSVLTTYNAGSPYVALSDWEGRPCHDCGYVMSDDDSSYCPSCEDDYCSECMSYCRCCEESRCRGCLDECPICGEMTCSTCMGKCPECGRPVCKTCLEENEAPCCEARKDNEYEDDERAARATACED